MNEQFSAFLDNEATLDEADSVINVLLTDRHLRDSWTRQHWLRTTLRAHSTETAVALDAGFSSRVMQAIAADTDMQHVGEKRPVAAFSPASPVRARRRRRWRGMAGLAAVASAAGVVLLVSNPMQRTEPPAQRMPVAVTSAPSTASATTSASLASDNGRSASRTSRVESIAGRSGHDDRVADVSRSAQPVADRQTVGNGPADHWSVSDPQLEDELNGYLVDHNGLARSYGLSGTTPALVRVATYGQETAQ